MEAGRHHKFFEIEGFVKVLGELRGNFYVKFIFPKGNYDIANSHFEKCNRNQIFKSEYVKKTLIDIFYDVLHNIISNNVSKKQIRKYEYILWNAKTTIPLINHKEIRHRN